MPCPRRARHLCQIRKRSKEANIAIFIFIGTSSSSSVFSLFILGPVRPGNIGLKHSPYETRAGRFPGLALGRICLLDSDCPVKVPPRFYEVCV